MRDAKAETLVDGVANFRHAFIYSEHEITPLKLFAALEILYPPGSTWEFFKMMAPKIHIPTLHASAMELRKIQRCLSKAVC